VAISEIEDKSVSKKMNLKLILNNVIKHFFLGIIIIISKPVTRRINGLFLQGSVSDHIKDILLTRITTRVDLAMSVCPSVSPSASANAKMCSPGRFLNSFPHPRGLLTIMSIYN